MLRWTLRRWASGCIGPIRSARKGAIMGLTTLLDNAPEVNGGNGGNGEAAGVHLAKQFRSWDTRVNVHFSSAVDDALHLLRYAAQVGISIDETSRDSILCAAKADASEVDADVWANLIAALTTLAAQTRPITADTLRTSSDDQAKPAIASLRRWTLILALPIILLS